MRSILLLVAVLALAGLGWLFLSGSSTDAPVPLSPEPAVPAPLATDPEAANGTLGAASTAEMDALRQTAEPARTEVTGLAAADVRVVVSGRLVDRSGQPRAGVELGWRSWRTGDLDVEILEAATVGRGRDRAEGPARTGADGRFSFAIGKGRAGSVFPTGSDLVLRRGQGAFSTAKGDLDLGDLSSLRPASIRGVVRDEKGQPVEGVTVGSDTTRLGLGLAHEAKTNAAGEFAMTGMQEGTWHLRTLSPQFLPATLELQLADEEQKDGVALELKRGNAIAGQVVDDRGQPVVGAKVGCMRREKSGPMTIARFAEDEATTTNENGWFTLAGLTGETATVRATHRMHDRAMADDVTVGTGNLVLRMPRLAVVRGVLKDTTGKPLAGSVVTARRAGSAGAMLAGEGADPTGEALLSDLDVDFDVGEVAGDLAQQELRSRPGQSVTREDGSFEIEGVRPGPITVRARGKAHRPAERKGLEIGAAQTLEGIHLVADVGAAALVRVVDERGEPVAGAKVALKRPEEQPTGGAFQMRSARRVSAGADAGDGVVHVAGLGDDLGKGTTDEKGEVRIQGLPSGAVEARGKHEHFAPSIAVPATLPVQGEVELKVVLRTPGVARLSTTDASGGGVAAEFVVRGPLGENGAEDRRGKTGTDGLESVEGLPPGRYEAELTKKPRRQSFGDGNSIVFLGDGGNAGMKSTRVEFEVTAGATVDVALKVPTMAKVKGRATGSAGPVAGVSVRLTPQNAANFPGAERMAEIPDLSGETTTTDATGAYEISDLEPGRYRLSWGLPEQMVKDQRDVEIRAGETEVVHDLPLRFGTVRLVVADDKGEPLEGAEVELQVATADGAPRPRAQRMMMITMNRNGDGDGNTSSSSMTLDAQRATSDIDGLVEIPNVPPGKYVVRVTHDRHAKKEVPDQVVGENAVTDCGQVKLQPAARIRGRVLTADGKPVQMALVSCKKVGAEGVEPERQPAMGGSFTFTGLASGRYAISAEAIGPASNGTQGPVVEVDVEAGRTKGDVEVRLPAR